MTSTRRFEELSVHDLGGRISESSILLLPLGAIEAHGPHLPLGTDLLIAEHAVHSLVDRFGDELDVWALPSLGYTKSNEHAWAPGTVWLSATTMLAVLDDIGRSLATTRARKLVFVNGHGGNHDALSAAVSRCVADGRRVLGWSPSVPAGGDLHAGRTETSVMSVIHPELVRAERVAPGATGALDVLLASMRRGGVRSVAASGVLGDPTGHSEQEGDRILAAWTRSLVLAFDTWCENAAQR